MADRSVEGDLEMDPVYERWRGAVDKLVEADDYFKSLPENHPDKKKAWAAVRLAMQSLGKAPNEIEPKFSS